MKHIRFLIGITIGVTITILVAALVLVGLGHGNTPAAAAGTGSPISTSGTPTSTPSKQVIAGTPGPSHAEVSALEQQMLQAVSDTEWSAAATQLGMTVDEMTAALNAGKTVAELGSTHNQTAQQIKDVMITAGQACVSAAVQAGTISQANADTLNKGLVVAIANKVTQSDTAPDGTPSVQDQPALAQKQAAQPDAGVNEQVMDAELNAAARTLGISNEQFKTALGPDSNMGDFLAAQHVTAQQVKDAMIAAGQSALDQAVQNGTVTQAGADQIQQDTVQPLAEKIFQMINGGQTTSAP